ncbi:tyrosine-type recombinase/integrase [Candidatus Saccharibacteria bacterium]|nr:tyrosine-type recombinase/integrase [Candidatus Saccharibacteria bacterium]
MAENIPNLHSRKAKGRIYYRYLMPDGQYESLGADRKYAIDAAIALNERRAASAEMRGAEEAEGSARKMLTLINAYEPVKMGLVKAGKSQSETARMLKRYREWMGHWSINGVTVNALDSLLREKAEAYESYRRHKILLTDIFTYAIGRGWRRDTLGNPGGALLPAKLARGKKPPKQRSRLTLEQFKSLYDYSPPWLQVALDIGLRIGIRRGDLCALKFSDVRDGCLYFIPQKTEDLSDPAALRIPLDEHLQSVINRAKLLRPQSDFLIHKQNRVTSGEAAGRVDRGQVLPEQLTRAFARVRDKAMTEQPAVWQGVEQSPPTFHEVRSLCARLNRGARPDDELQLLLGHAEFATTEIYLVENKVRWATVAAGVVV